MGLIIVKILILFCNLRLVTIAQTKKVLLLVSEVLLFFDNYYESITSTRSFNFTLLFMNYLYIKSS